TIEGAPGLKDEHLPVFDCAFQPAKGKRSIHYMGHVKMMAAVQPFLSGAISKTVNMPNDVTPDDIADTYLEAWKMGLKAIAIYRDGCKRVQPLNTKRDVVEEKKASAPVIEMPKPVRRRLPDERKSITHKFSIAGHEGYLTVGMYEDGTPGEIFVVMAKEGSVVSGLMDSFATMVSLALQYGVPMHVLVRKFQHARFEPSGFTTNPQIPIAKSITDYIFRWLALKFLPKEELGASNGHNETETEFGDAVKPHANGASQPKPANNSASVTKSAQAESLENRIFQSQSDAPPCHECGSVMVRSGSCYKCFNCGATSGCS
ncbi:vitamin B12-dependent ribonucleotide reductase, partial [candidate division KSB1 bacterium]|nr:vitamin B12-dependent ribonucleotide reductase [candidate division KSB1 bacterium]